MRSFASLTFVAKAVVLVLVCLALGGCKTQKIDWGARVGTYTFDQAVSELGPPARQAKLQDGSLVAEWLTQRGGSNVYYPPYNYGYYPRYGSYAGPIVTSTPDWFLRLTFDPAGRLKEWKKVVQ